MTRFDLSTTELVLSESLITHHEMQLYQALTTTLDTQYSGQFIICPKVRIGDIIRLKKENFNYGIRSRYRARHFDFVICSKDSLQPVLAIELQDKTHKTGKGKYVDALKRELCKHAGLDLLQLWTTNLTDIRNLLYYRLDPAVT